MYQKLSENLGQTLEVFHYDYFELRDDNLYYKFKSNDPLTTKIGNLRAVGELRNIIGKDGLRKLGYDIAPGKENSRNAKILEEFKDKLLSKSDVANAEEIELQKILKNVSRSIENISQQLVAEGFTIKELRELRELRSVNKEMGRIRVKLKVEMAKKLDLEEEIEKQKEKLPEIESHPEYTDD